MRIGEEKKVQAMLATFCFANYQRRGDDHCNGSSASGAAGRANAPLRACWAPWCCWGLFARPLVQTSGGDNKKKDPPTILVISPHLTICWPSNMGSQPVSEEGDQVVASPLWTPDIPPRSSSRVHAGGREGQGAPRVLPRPITVDQVLSMDHELRTTQPRTFSPIPLKNEEG